MHCFKMGSHNSVIRASPSPKETAFYWGWEKKVDRETIYWQKCKAYQHFFLPGFYIWAFSVRCQVRSRRSVCWGAAKNAKNCARFPPTYFIFSVFALLLTWPIMMLSIHPIKCLKQAGIVLVLLWVKKKSRHIFNQSDSKLKPVADLSSVLSRAFSWSRAFCSNFIGSCCCVVIGHHFVFVSILYIKLFTLGCPTLMPGHRQNKVLRSDWVYSEDQSTI